MFLFCGKLFFSILALRCKRNQRKLSQLVKENTNFLKKDNTLTVLCLHIDTTQAQSFLSFWF